MRRQFDFWLGTWECRWDGGHGSNTITAELDGMVILERFDGRPGTELQGISVSIFDERENAWRQTWVDSSGGFLDFVGVFDDGVMDLRREAIVDGGRIGQRMRWTEIEDDSFVWLWERLPAGSRNWETLWRIEYSRR